MKKSNLCKILTSVKLNFNKIMNFPLTSILVERLIIYKIISGKGISGKKIRLIGVEKSGFFERG